MCSRINIILFCPIPLVFASLLLAADAFADEPYNSGWQINADNDLFTGLAIDRDYTGGFAFTMSGKRVQQYPVSIDAWRGAVDSVLGFHKLFQSSDLSTFHSQQYGITFFTPEDIEESVPLYNDRPYANLIFMSNTEFTVVPADNTAYVSRLTIGFLGLDIAEDIQSLFHGTTDSIVSNGWQNQISSGGEPTAMMTYGKQDKLYVSTDHQLKTEYEANLGFITDVNAGISWRWGHIHSPWWGFNPYQSKYIQQSMPVFSGASVENDGEFYLWAGGRLSLRIYNSLLQGQFKKSEVTISNADLERLVYEYWFGVTQEFFDKYYVSAFVRGMSEEYQGVNARNPVWVGLVLTRAY
jgi:hypothetical protein